MTEDAFHQAMVKTGLISQKDGKYTDHALRGDIGQPLPTDECRVCGGKTDPYEEDYGVCYQCMNSKDEITKKAVEALIQRDRQHGAKY